MRTPSHVAVAPNLARVGQLKHGKCFTREVPLKLDSGMDTHNLRVIEFVQEPKL